MKKGLMIVLLSLCLIIVGSYIISNLEITGYAVKDIVPLDFDVSYVWMINILLCMLVLTIAVTKKIESNFGSKIKSLEGTYDTLVARGSGIKDHVEDLSRIDSEIERLKRELA